MTPRVKPQPTTVTCPECPFEKTARTPALARKALNMHSCEYQRELAARAARVEARKNAPDGPKRDCTHKKANHVHGTRQAYVLDKCRCRPCRNANSQCERRLSRLKAYGRYDTGRVDAQPVREHLQALIRYGLGLKRIARLARVSNATLGKILYGDPSRNMPPRARVERHVHESVLAVRPSLEALGATVTVDGTGTRRRLQALVYIGYSQSYLADRLGMLPGNFCRTIQARRVQAETARQARALFEELQNRPREGWDQRSRISVNRAKRYARGRGWLPPAAWDEDRLDDPKHKGYKAQVAA